MNDKEFDKIFGDRLREERLFPYDDADWRHLSKLLDSAQMLSNERRKRRFLTLLLLLLGLPILAGLTWSIYSLEKRNRALTEQINHLEKNIALSDSQIDSIETELRTLDTLQTVQYVYLEKNVSQNQIKKTDQTPATKTSAGIAFSTKNEQGRADINIPNEPKQDSLQPKLLDCEKRAETLTAQLAVAEQQITELKKQTNAFAEQTTQLQAWANRQDSLQRKLADFIAQIDSLKKPTQKSLSDPLSKERDKAEKETKPLKNNRFYIGLRGGSAAYKASWYNAAGIEIYKNISSYQVGSYFEYALSDQWRLIGGGDYCPFDIDIYWQNERYNLPNTTLAWGERFLKSSAKQKMVQGHIGAKYLLTESSRKWRPYASAAYGLLNIRPFETTHEYQKTTSPYSVRTETVASKGLTVANFLIGAGGIEYRWTQNLFMNVEAYYYKDLNKPLKAYDIFGLRGGLIWGF
jgi:hypothetical protein